MIPKFRAWDKEDKRMSYGEIEYYDDSFGVRFDHFCVGADFEVEFMQSTGLKDKNNVEIYEGDIVRVAESDVDCYISAVKNYAEEGYPAFDIECPNGWYYESNILSAIMAEDFETIEIIGNIYENPELLEVK